MTRFAPLLGLWLALAPAAAGAQDTPTSAPPAPAPATAIFAAGCFWCIEADFDKVPGVLSTLSGYTGGTKPSPSYGQVVSGTTGHAEAIQVTYDPARVSYERLLQTFWRNVDPVDAGGQFCDRGPQYRSAIFVQDAEQRRLAEASKEAIARSGRLPKPIVTEITQAGAFYPAEDYHQDYYHKNPLRYDYYRRGCGRDARLQQLWGKEPIPTQ